MRVDSRKDTFHAEHDGWRVEILDRDQETATCKVWYAGSLIFDGITREALAQKVHPVRLADLPEEDWEGPSLRPHEVVGMWLNTLMSTNHRILSAMYVGTGMEGRTYCGRTITVPAAPNYLSKAEPSRGACGSCRRI